MGGCLQVSKNLETIIKAQIELENSIINILEDAARCERFISAPNNKNCPSMYKILETYYDKKDWGYHATNKMVLRATPKQMTNYSYAIDLLLDVKEDISDDPKFARQLLWMKANRYSMSYLGKWFGVNRIKLKHIYRTILAKLATKVRKNYKFDKLNNFI
jgi:hypothetical protein